MKLQNIFRLCFVAVVWLILVVYILRHATINFFTLFAILASGILVFVPLYKRLR